MNIRGLSTAKADKIRVTAICLAMALLAMMLATPTAQAYTAYVGGSVVGNDSYSIVLDGAGATAASGSVEASGTWSGHAYSSSASSSVDWSLGETRFRIAAQNSPAWADASAMFENKIYPQWVLGTKTDPINVQVIFTATGSYTNTYLGAPSTTPPNFNGGWGLSADFFAGVNYVARPFNQYSLIGGGNKSQTFDLIFTPGTDSYLFIYESLWGWLSPYNGQTVVADYSNTGTVQIILPEGAFFTSESPGFLTGGNNAVPVPPTVWLLGSGLLGLVGWRRFRKG